MVMLEEAKIRNHSLPPDDNRVHVYQWVVGETSLNLMYRDRIITVPHSQYHGCWCPGSLRRQDTRAHDVDYVG